MFAAPFSVGEWQVQPVPASVMSMPDERENAGAADPTMAAARTSATAPRTAHFRSTGIAVRLHLRRRALWRWSEATTNRLEPGVSDGAGKPRDAIKTYCAPCETRAAARAGPLEMSRPHGAEEVC